MRDRQLISSLLRRAALGPADNAAEGGQGGTFLVRSFAKETGRAAHGSPRVTAAYGIQSGFK